MVDLPSDNADEQRAFEAAWHTFRQNAADLFTDCPTRERAGWLCDSFFIARAAQFFTNNALMEKQFLENFILPDSFYKLPDGMVPMCYPSDHFSGNFILNWALWYVAELEDYTRRTEDTALAARSKDLVYRMLKYLKTIETTETCQYHAFFFGIVTPESHPELWKKMITDFGPQREKTGLYPKVHPSNAFTGNLLRLDILLRYGLYDQCRREVLGYYTDMARLTGTLWGHMDAQASCNHGFAAYAANLLYYSIKKEEPPFKLNL